MTPKEYADLWRNEIGVNVIPAISKTKKPIVTWAEWQDKPIPQEIHDEWKTLGKFDQGMAVICGKVFHNKEHENKWLNGIDCDNKKGIEVMCPSGLEKIAGITIVEQHANKDKCHIYFYTKDPIKSKVANDGKNGTVPQIEIKSGGKFLLYCSGSTHKDNSPIEILGINKVKTVDKEPLESRINSICKEYNLPYLEGLAENLKPVKDIIKEGIIIHEGENRSLAILRYLDSKKITSPEFDEDILFNLGMKFNLTQCNPPYDESLVRGIAKQALGYGEKIVAENQQEESKLSKSADLIDKVSEKIKSEFDLITNRQNKEILMFNGKIYRQDSSTKAIIEERTEKIIANCSTHESIEVVNKLKRLTGADLDVFDSEANILCLNNGLLDIENIELSPHTPKHLSTVLIPVDYQKPRFEIHDETIFDDVEKNLKDTLFWKFLKSSFTINDDFKKQDFESVLEIIASFFIKKIIDEKAFMFLGRGENGKSVLTEYIINMLGLDNVEKISLQALSDDKYMGAKLVGKMANIYSDLNDNSFNDTSFVKNATSGEGIEVQHKYGNPFVLVPFCNLLFSANRFPKVNDQTHGFFRRWMIVKWRVNFENHPDRDEHLKDKLRDNQEEKSLVFSTLIHLSRLLLKNGKFSHSKDAKETQKEWNTNSDPLNDFVETCIIDSDGNKNVRKTYSFYRQIMESRQETPLSIVQFGRSFKEYFDQQVTKDKDGKSERVWINIDFIIPTVNDYTD